MSKEIETKIGQLQYEISILGLDKEELTGVTNRTEELKQLVKNLSIHGVITRLKNGAKVYKEDKEITGLIIEKSNLGFNNWIVDWGESNIVYEYGIDLNVL